MHEHPGKYYIILACVVLTFVVGVAQVDHKWISDFFSGKCQERWSGSTSQEILKRELIHETGFKEKLSPTTNRILQQWIIPTIHAHFSLPEEGRPLVMMIVADNKDVLSWTVQEIAHKLSQKRSADILTETEKEAVYKKIDKREECPRGTGIVFGIPSFLDLKPAAVSEFFSYCDDQGNKFDRVVYVLGVDLSESMPEPWESHVDDDGNIILIRHAIAKAFSSIPELKDIRDPLLGRLAGVVLPVYNVTYKP